MYSCFSCLQPLYEHFRVFQHAPQNNFGVAAIHYMVTLYGSKEYQIQWFCGIETQHDRKERKLRKVRIGSQSRNNYF